MNAANSPLVKPGLSADGRQPVKQAERGQRSGRCARAKSGVVRAVVGRPGFGAVAGIVLVFLFFAIGSRSFTEPGAVSTWLAPSSLLGLSAIPVALLMIGGEFDLSAGVMIGSTSLVTGLLCTRRELEHLACSAGVARVRGRDRPVANGLLVSRTGLPSSSSPSARSSSSRPQTGGHPADHGQRPGHRCQRGAGVQRPEGHHRKQLHVERG